MGGVAYVSPPQRPGAQLWSIVAGPLVNVVLAPVLAALLFLAYELGWSETNPNLYTLISCVLQIDIGLLVFNLLPIYPMDGGQILRSLLWFFCGRANSLLVASIIGFIGIGGLLLLAGVVLFKIKDMFDGVWLAAIAFVIALNCWGGLRQSLALARLAKMPRREGFACPACKMAPPLGELWRCGKCGRPFDTFQTLALCPHCGTQYNATQCLDCGASHPITEWHP